MKIVVTGSVGHISKPLVAELLSKGHQVKVISSNADRKPVIEQIGASAAIGSVRDKLFLENAFANAEAVYTMVPPVSYFEADLDVIKQFSEVAIAYKEALTKTGVKQVVNLSSWGAHRDNGTGGIVGTYYYERIMNELTSDVTLVHIRPTSFYYNLLNYIPAIKHSGRIASNHGGDDRCVFVAPSDIASAIVDELENKTERRGVSYVASDEMTCNQAARILGEAIGKPDLQWVLIPEQEAQKNLERAGMPSSSVKLLIELQSAHHRGLTAEDYLLHKPALGKVKLIDFAKEFAAAYLR